jgi:DNA helicase HerA-like ATPase
LAKLQQQKKNPTTIDEFYFWTTKDRVLNPFDVVTVNHIENSKIYGVIEEISHITDTPSYLTSFISCDFGDVNCGLNTQRIGMNFVKARVVGNTKSIYTPALDGSDVMFSTIEEIQEALGLDDVKNKLVCGYLEMYENNEKNKQTLPVHFNSHFLVGPEGAHLNISGISGLASKTSYAMFLLKAIQDKFMNNPDEDDVAFVLLNVKGRDLLAIDEPNLDLEESQKEKYSMLGLDTSPFKNVKYFYPYSSDNSNSYHRKDDIEEQKKDNKAFLYKYLYDEDKGSLDMLFANIDDPTQTMDSINNFVVSEQGKFGQIRSWTDFQMEVGEYCKAGANKGDKEITVSSWRKYKRVVGKALSNEIFGKATSEKNKEVRLRDSIADIKKNDIYVIDVARLDETMQGFVFGDVIRAVYDLKLGIDGVDEDKIPSRIIIFIDELNKYASSDVPRNSPILRQIIDITERGRSLGIVLFSAEQFKSAIHDRVKGNCSTHAYGRTNAIEISKNDYRYVPHVFKNMMTRLKQGEYIVQNPVFRSLLNVKFPKPLYKQFK